MRKHTDKINLNRATLSDIHEIAKMQIDGWEEDFNRTSIDPLLKNLLFNELKKRWNKQLVSGSETYVLLKHGKIIGYVSFKKNLARDTDEPIIELQTIYIIPSLRRKGFGKRLCAALLNRLKRESNARLITWVINENIGAQSFYQALGFICTTNKRVEIIHKNTAITETQYTLEW